MDPGTLHLLARELQLLEYSAGAVQGASEPLKGSAIATCYWTLCDCPNQEPCPEHSGYFCGRWTTVRVANPAQVNDAVTRQADLAIAALDRDRSRAREIQRQLLERRAELEQARADIERGLTQSNSRSERRATVEQIRSAYRRVGEVKLELQQILAELNALNVNAFTAGTGLTLSLIVPYTSPTGYCECYEEKKRQLAALDGRVASVQTLEFNPLVAKLNFLISQGRGIFEPIPDSGNVVKLIGSLTFAAVVIVYLLVGLIGAILTAVVGILLATLAIVSLLIDLSRVDAALAAASQKIVRLRLQYYRLQEIATCRRLVAGAAVPPVFVDENAWYQLATGTAGEAGEPPPEEED